MNITKVKKDIKSVFDHIEKTEKLIDFIYVELESINLDNDYDTEKTIEKIIAKIENLDEIIV